jgi:hypothetical protein
MGHTVRIMYDQKVKTIGAKEYLQYGEIRSGRIKEIRHTVKFYVAR